ncbi:ABC transporter substrate-binding protein [Escherichia coli]|nr:ABC transporter substrate-binding protein [Escherichia coli]
MTLLMCTCSRKNYQLAMNKEVKGFVFNPMLEQVFNINTMSK